VARVGVVVAGQGELMGHRWREQPLAPVSLLARIVCELWLVTHFFGFGALVARAGLSQLYDLDRWLQARRLAIGRVARLVNKVDLLRLQ